MNAFSVKEPGALESADAFMKQNEFRARRLAKDQSVKTEELTLSTEGLSRSYPLFASSLFSLIKNCEDGMEK